MSRTIMIMAGGTGGHVFPGLAVAECLKTAGWQVAWLGTAAGLEQRLVPQRGYALRVIHFSGVRGKGLLAWALLPLRLLTAFWQSLKVLRETRPDVVLGMGGYPAFPGGMMAALLNRPLAIHEQNAVPGLANKVLARLADRVLLGFAGALSGREVRVTGNPVRREIAALPAPAQRMSGRSGPQRLLVVGGSLGARALNEAVPAALALLAPAARPQVTHQTGAAQLDAVRRAYDAAGVAARVLPFIEDMATAYAESDLVLCRAGALTVAELAAAGAAAILVPFPHAVDDHQTANARYLAQAGAALLLPQPELTPQKLAELLMGLDRARLLAMAEQARALGRPGAAEAVAQACMELAK